MKNITNIAQYMAFTMFLMMSGCVAYPEFENADNGDNGTPVTRVQSDGKYYYAFDEKVPLNEVAGRVVVTFDKEHRSSVEQYIMQNALAVKEEQLPIGEGYSEDYSVITINESPDKKVSIDDLSKQAGIKSVRQVYAIDDGYEMGYTNEVIMQFKNGVSQQEIGEMHKRFNVEVIKTSALYVLLSVPVEFDPLDVANAYQESGLTSYSHPNFITSVSFAQSLPTDPYFNNQFYLRNTGQSVNGRTSTAGVDINVVPAWNITKGSSNIVVAVIDEGVTSNHPDLPNSRQVRLNGSNFGSGNANDPSPTGNANHGNACAGIIAASHNGEGIAGIAPNCKILPIRMGGGIPDIVDAIELAANNADILSCSWGLMDSNGYLSSSSNLYPTVVNAIRYATTSGRRGSKGSVVVFCTHNTANRVAGNNGFIAFPANVNISGVLTVGAVDRNGQQANYSPTSNPSSSQNQIIDVVAPSHKAYSSQISSETFDVWSIDIPGTAGYNYVHGTDGGSLPVVGSYLPNSGTNYQAYTGHFGGTSAAAPQVSGIAALLLSKYPNMTASQVHNIITSTASNYYSWNNQLGYGIVNANKALFGHLVITKSNSNPVVVNAYTTFFTPEYLATGVTRQPWTVTSPSGGSYTTLGGTSGSLIEIKFNTAGTYTLQRPFSLPSGYSLTATMSVTVLAAPSLAGDMDTVNDPEHQNEAVYWLPTQEGEGYFYVTNHDYQATYEWKVNGQNIPAAGGSGYLWVNANSVPQWRSIPVECRWIKGGQTSGWSKVYVYVSPSRPTWLAPAPTPNAPDEEVPEEEESTVGTDE